MNYRIIIFAFLLIFIFSPNQIISFQIKDIDLAVKRFEQKNSKSSVIIINSRTAKIEYVYNRDFAINRKFPPGSIAKLWSAVILLEHSDQFEFDPHREIFCKGKFFEHSKFNFKEIDDKIFNLPIDKKLNTKYFKCALRDGHGSIDLMNAIIKSCNVYFLTHASKNPRQFYKLLIKKWHLNENTKAPLNSNIEPRDILSGPISTFMYTAASIGEGGTIRVSPLKVAQTYAAFFENTPLLIPFEKKQKIGVQFPLDISNRHRDFINEALSQVFITGTLKDISIKNEHIKIIAAKTGTGTHLNKRYTTHGWNVIYFRLKKQNYVMTTFVYKGSGMKEARRLSGTVLDMLK